VKSRMRLGLLAMRQVLLEAEGSTAAGTGADAGVEPR